MTQYSGDLNGNGIPNFEDLPLKKGDPHHSAWGLYGGKDELGALNRLTGERVVSAAREEIRRGMRWVYVFYVLGSSVSTDLSGSKQCRVQSREMRR